MARPIASRRPTGLIGKTAERRGIGDDGPVLQSCDQFAPDSGVDGRDESEPETRQTRGQQRNRDHHALQPALPRVLAHHVAVARLIGPADFERAALAVGQLKCGGKIGEQVIDADRLRQCRDPARADHDRQSLDERADQLERQAAGPDHDGRAKFHDGDSAFAQHLPGLDPALEMLAERLVARGEAAEVHDSPNPGPPRRVAKIAGGHAILFEVVAVCAHGVHEVIGHVDSREGAIEGRRIEEVPRDDLRRRRHARRERGRLPRETAKPDSRGFEDGHQPSPDVAGRTRHEYRWRVSATPAAATSPVDRPNERRQKRLQLVGPRGVESAVMEPPHDALPVEDDQVGIVFMRGRIGEPLLPVACASVDRDDVIVEFDRGALAHPSVDEPPAERPQPANHRDLEQRDVRLRIDRRPVPFRPRLNRKTRLVREADRHERDLAGRRLRQHGVAARQELSLQRRKPIADPQGLLRGSRREVWPSTSGALR